MCHTVYKVSVMYTKLPRKEGELFSWALPQKMGTHKRLGTYRPVPFTDPSCWAYVGATLLTMMALHRRYIDK